MRSTSILTCLLVALITSGCLASHEMATVHRDVSRAHPDAQFERDVAFSAGPLMLRTVWSVTRLGEMERLRPFLTAIEGVKLGVYTVTGELTEERLDIPVIDRMRSRGWAVAARVEETPEQTWLLYNAHADRIREFYMLRLDSSQLIVVRLRGDLERIIATAMAEQGWNVSPRALSLNL